MTFRAFMQRAGKSAVSKIAVLLVCVLALGGCDRHTPLTVVRAVAAGVPSLAPFFDESSGLGHDTEVRSQAVRGSLQQGDTPGLYGGTRQPTICDVRKLKAFLTAPGNHRKAQAWASALNITTDRIPGYLDRLTPVLLRHDTLVENHDYRKGKAVPFDSLLQAGIAVLVDQRGLPAVKCSCGNPLRPFRGDTHRISVRFENGNRKWTGYERSSVVAVRPAPRGMARLVLVDVAAPDQGIARPVGTTGAHDTAFDAGAPRTVPDVTGTTFGAASRRLTAAGLAVGYAGKTPPADDARVTASDPAAGAQARFGAYVTLSVAAGGSPTPPPQTKQTKPTKPTEPPEPTKPSSKAPPSSPSSPSTGSPAPSTSPPSSTPRSAPPPPPTSSAPPPETPVTPSAPPPETRSAPATSAPATSVPATSEPASSAPAPSEPGSSGPGTSASASA
ncbi:DUF6777 domain-containing protein [Streptomyces sp. 7R007]